MSGRREVVSVRLAAVVYGRASRLLPSEFRAEYGEELKECFREIAAEARDRGVLAVASVTVRAVVDLVTRAPKEHLAAARAGALVPGAGLGGTWQDVRHAGRRLRRRPSFAVATVLTLALGIAAATSVFTMVHGVVLSPLPYPESDRIVQVDHGARGLGLDRGMGVTHGFYRFYRERLRTAQSMAMYGQTSRTLTRTGEPVRLTGLRTTPSLGTVLGIRPEVGRWFTEEEGEAGAAPAVVLSHRLWRERFGSDPEVVGRTVVLEGETLEVVGVTRRSFAFPSSDIDFWVVQPVPETGVGGWNFAAVALLAPGAAPADMEREMASLFGVLRETTDDPTRMASYLDEAGVVPRIVSLKESTVGDIRATLWILMGTVGSVLLIALANVANLFLVRAEESQRETALRSALGAGGARLVRGYMAETLLVAGAAGVLGVAMAAFGVAVLRDRAPVNIPRLDEVNLDPTVVGLTAAVTLGLAVALGLIPALRGRGDLSSSLKEGQGRATSDRGRLRGRSMLVGAQVALAMVLLVGSGLLFRSFQELRSADLGFSEREALTFQLGLPAASYGTPAEQRRFHQELIRRLESVAGVETVAAVASCLPLTPNMCWGTDIEAEGSPNPEGGLVVVGVRLATLEYFDALGIPVRGRTFTSADETGDRPVAILSESTAGSIFPEEEPIGRRVRFEGDLYEVVGVAADVRARVETEEFLNVVYLPLTPEPAGPPPSNVWYVITSAVEPASLTPAVRRVVEELDPALPLADLGTLRDRIDRATAPTAFALTLIGLAAAIALLLGAVGVYAVVAYAVSRRTAEIGVRMALGAARSDVRRMVVRQGGSVVVAGVGVGLVAALGMSRLMQGMLYGVRPTDPLSYLVLTLVMLTVAGLALYLPARRASRVDPLQALRSD